MRSALLSGLVVAFGLSTMSAQQPAAGIRGPAASVLFTAHTTTWGEPTASDTTTRAVPATHWKQGLLIGGVIGTVGFGALLYGLCEDLDETQESCVGSGLGGAALGAVIGGTVGALIGGLFPMQTDTLAGRDSTAASE
jgi:hypothetical protein